MFSTILYTLNKNYKVLTEANVTILGSKDSHDSGDSDGVLKITLPVGKVLITQAFLKRSQAKNSRIMKNVLKSKIGTFHFKTEIRYFPKK